VAWIYTGKIEDRDLDIECPATAGKFHAKKPRPVLLGKLCVLAQRVLVPNLRLLAEKLVFEMLWKAGGPELKQSADFAYSGEYKDLRRLLVQVLASKRTSPRLTEIVNDLCQPLLVDLVKYRMFLDLL
jgi:hypothetical protein